MYSAGLSIEIITTFNSHLNANELDGIPKHLPENYFTIQNSMNCP